MQPKHSINELSAKLDELRFRFDSLEPDGTGDASKIESLSELSDEISQDIRSLAKELRDAKPDELSSTTHEQLLSSTEPNWEPLKRVLPEEQCGPFMYMGGIPYDGTVIYFYKQRDARHLCLSEDGRVWRDDGKGGYVETELSDVIQDAMP